MKSRGIRDQRTRSWSRIERRSSRRSLREKGNPSVSFLLVRPFRLGGKDDAMERRAGALPGMTEQLFDAITEAGMLYGGRRQIERREMVE